MAHVAAGIPPAGGDANYQRLPDTTTYLQTPVKATPPQLLLFLCLFISLMNFVLRINNMVIFVVYMVEI